MEALAQTCADDGEWDPPSPVQEGRGDEPQPGPAGLQYTIRKKGERTYAKNAAVDRTYLIKIDEKHQGQNLRGIQDGLHRMFEDVLNQAKGDLAGNDLGRIIIVPLQTWDQLDVNKVMEIIEKVLNSHQELLINESFIIVIETKALPKGGARRRITKIKGEKNSLHLKKSIVNIENDDQLCMARAIGVSWVKLRMERGDKEQTGKK